MKVRLAVPRRADGGHRDRLWRYCRAHWEKETPDWEIREGIHDVGPFNRSAAVNAAAVGDWDVLVILDADVVLDADQVREGVVFAARAGTLVLPYTTRQLVNAVGTRGILEGYDGPWRQWAARDTNRAHVSSCVIVPRALWDAVGGFDERFSGWGGEDDAFHAACRALAGVERLAGDVFHLHHEWSPWRDHRSGAYRCARLLADRYCATRDAGSMHDLLAEPRTDDATVLVVLTTGTRTTLHDTVTSAAQNLRGPIGRRLMVVDGNDTIRTRLADEYRPAGFDVVNVRAGGYGPAVAAAMDLAIGSGQPWIWWLEDDFTFEQPVDVRDLQAAMLAEPRLVQMSLKRQAVYPHEVAAGGIIEADPKAFRQRDGWVEHWRYWTQNPMLTTRTFLASRAWPKGQSSEQRFGRELFERECDPLGGIWGRLEDPPRVTHTGTRRAGRAY